jgi:hypothetical protein
VSGQLQVGVALPSWKEAPVPIGQEIGWAPEPVWTLWGREHSCTAGNRIRAFQPVARPYLNFSAKWIQYKVAEEAGVVVLTEVCRGLLQSSEQNGRKAFRLVFAVSLRMFCDTVRAGKLAAQSWHLLTGLRNTQTLHPSYISWLSFNCICNRQVKGTDFGEEASLPPSVSAVLSNFRKC